jgi:predicted MFS family arabinose efflux permease
MHFQLLTRKHRQINLKSSPTAAAGALISFFLNTIFPADFIDNIGSWLSYIATLELVESFSDGSGLALSAVILIRFFPSLLLSPLAGVLADRCNRVKILILAAIADAAIVAALVLVHNPSQTPLLFALLTAQFTAIALQDPARRAILPVLVPESELHLATTLETFSWSLTGAVGAAVGGGIASKLGNSACFLIDAFTYLLASWFAFRVPFSMGDPYAMEKHALRKQRSNINPEDLVHGGGSGGGGSSNDNNNTYSGSSRDVELAEVKLPPSEHHLHSAEHRKVAGGEREAASLLIAPPQLAAAMGTSTSTTPSITYPAAENNLTPAHSGGSATTTTTAAPQIAFSFQSMSAAAWGSCIAGWSAAVEGWRYLLAPENRDVAALVIMKGCGSLTWGAVDILNVKFSEKESMQVGDSSTTLGVIFATVGIGCFLGPVFLNAAVEPRPRPLLWASALAFIFLFAGSVLLAAARKLYMVLAATLVRAVGSATLWIYSTLLLQLRCPNTILGRVSAAEMAFYTICEAVSSVYGGAAFDVLGLSLEQTTASLAVIAGFVAAGWIFYAWRQQQVLEIRSSGSGGSSSDYKSDGVWGEEDELRPLQLSSSSQ